MNRFLPLGVLLGLLLTASAAAQEQPTAFLSEDTLNDAIEDPPRYRAVPGTETLVLTPEGFDAARAFADRKPNRPGVDHTDETYLRPGPVSVTPPPRDLARGGPTFTVNGAGDRPDNNPGDGVCYTGFLITDGTFFANECTLRAALEETNAVTYPGSVLIAFDIFIGPAGSDLGNGRWRIAPTTTLPVLDRPNTVTIDGETQAGANCGDLVGGTSHDLRVVLDGVNTTGALGDPGSGFGLRSSSAITVRGLVVQNFNFGFGLYLTTSEALVECNYIGTDYTGETAAGNLDGIYAAGMVRNNLVSGNSYYGIFTRVYSSGTFMRNLVGSDDDGNEPLGNGRHGFYVASADNVITTNLVSANLDDMALDLGEGITLADDPFFGSGIVASSNELTNNTVGLTRTRDNGSGDMGNGRVGIWIRAGAHDNDIGLPGNGNFIANHDNEDAFIYAIAIRVQDASDNNRIRGNIIGLTASGAAAPNRDGIIVYTNGTSSGTVIGGSAPGAGNIIASSVRFGIYLIEALNVHIEGNTIGLNASGALRPNSEDGILIDGSDDVIVRDNTVSGNGGSGIRFADLASVSGASANALIENNRIGTNAAGTATRPNGLSGLVLIDATDATVTGNTISGNTDTGIFLSGGTSGHVFEDNFIGTNGAGANLGNGLPGGDGRAGVYCADASDIRIGRNFSPNTIRFNDADGIFIGQNCADASVVGNIIHSNGGLAVDLAPNGPDADEMPIITSAENDGASSMIGFALRGALPNTTYELLFCRNTSPDSSGYGECETPNALATVTTNGLGNAGGTRTLGAGAYPAGSWVTVNATVVEGALPAGYGPTSEFAEAVEVEDTAPVLPDYDLVAQNTSPLTVAPGGQVAFDYSVTNTTDADASGDLFFTVMPGGFSGVIASGTVQAGQTVNGSFVQQVPGAAPAGAYTYTLHIGQFPGTTVDAEAFTVTVTGLTREGDGATWTVREAAPWQAVGAASRGDEALPSEAALDGAYPNPFSRRATVAFSLPSPQRVALTIYDVLGREVAVLLDAEVEAGRHEAALDGSSLPSGVYLVRLVAGEEVQTQRLTRMR